MTTLLATPEAWPRVLSARFSAPPTDIAAARRDGAFEALERALRELGPAGTLAEVAASGLRGRGGSGYPTADKWRACATAAGDAIVIANGYGADPGSATDRTLLERDPWAVVEGALIAAVATGASEVIVVVPSDAPAALSAVEAAVDAAIDAGFAGVDPFGTGRPVLLSVRALTGSYMLGEETVLIRALEGRRAHAEQKPPYPATHGLAGRPTIVDNVATLAAVPWILRNGPDAFAAIGMEDAPGTVLVHVRGADGDGVAEAPTGTRLSDLTRLAGSTGPLKGYLVGGPTGGILPASAGDTAYGFATLREAGAHVGSGSIVTIGEQACVVDLVRVVTRFSADAACGKTIPCRIGLRRLAEVAERAAAGTARAGDDQLAADLASDIRGSGLCDHERLATLALAGAWRHFPDEVRAHVAEGRCPAGVCMTASAAVGSA